MASFTLTSGVDHIVGTADDDTITATSGTLSAGDQIDGGPGNNTLFLSGGGGFDLSKPATLINVQTIQASEGAFGSGMVQTVTLRDGLDATVDVTSVAGGHISITGANNAATINLGDGNDTVSIGGDRETVVGGRGADTFILDFSNPNLSSQTAATIIGGSGTNILKILGGTALTLVGSHISGMNQIVLGSGSADTNDYNFTADGTKHLLITANDGGTNEISLGDASQAVVINSSLSTNIVTAGIAQASAIVIGNANAVANGGSTTFELTDNGKYNLNSATKNVIVQMDGSGSLTLNHTGSNSVLFNDGAGLNSTLSVFSDSFGANDTWNGAGTDSLSLLGSGTFDFTNLSAISGFTKLFVKEGQQTYTSMITGKIASTYQTVNLASGMNVIVTVGDGSFNASNPNLVGTTINGASGDSSIIHLGKGHDFVNLGDSSEQVIAGSAGTALVTSTASTAGAFVKGNGGTVLELTGGGEFDLNAKTFNTTIKLDQASTVTLSQAADTYMGSSGDDTFIATGKIAAGTSLDGGGGTNVLSLQGPGTFDFSKFGALSNISSVTAQEGVGEIVRLSGGLNTTLNVTGAATGTAINIFGAAGDSSVIHLGAGNDSVTLGSNSETVIGGGGNDLIKVTAGTIGATIDGGAGFSTLSVIGGGTVAMGTNITDIGHVILAAATNFTANAINGLNVLGSTGGDTIAAGGSGQIITGGGGADTLISAGGDVFRDTIAHLNSSTFENIASGDSVDLTNMNPARASVTVVDNADGSETLTITSGLEKAVLHLVNPAYAFGVGDLTLSSDGGTGTLLGFHVPDHASTTSLLGLG